MPLPQPERCRRHAQVLEKLDEQLLPSLYAAISASFSATAQQLGYLTFGRALVQALCSPLGGLAGAAATPCSWVQAVHQHCQACCASCS